MGEPLFTLTPLANLQLASHGHFWKVGGSWSTGRESLQTCNHQICGHSCCEASALTNSLLGVAESEVGAPVAHRSQHGWSQHITPQDQICSVTFKSRYKMLWQHVKKMRGHAIRFYPTERLEKWHAVAAATNQRKQNPALLIKWPSE